MERLTHEADFGLEDWEETLFFVKSDPNGAYNIIDIAKYQGEPEFDEILKNVALRLAAYENTGLEPEEIVKIREDIENGYMKSTARRYGVPVDRLRELAAADREGRCVVLPKDGMVYYIEEAGGEKWIGNKPIQQVILRCGFGMSLLEFSLFDKGKYFSRADAEAALRGEQDG